MIEGPRRHEDKFDVRFGTIKVFNELEYFTQRSQMDLGYERRG